MLPLLAAGGRSRSGAGGHWLRLRDVRDPASRLSGFFLLLLAPDCREEVTAVRQVERLGFLVRHIVLTHLDLDHTGGLDDFPISPGLAGAR